MSKTSHNKFHKIVTSVLQKMWQSEKILCKWLKSAQVPHDDFGFNFKDDRYAYRTFCIAKNVLWRSVKVFHTVKLVILVINCFVDANHM